MAFASRQPASDKTDGEKTPPLCDEGVESRGAPSRSRGWQNRNPVPVQGLSRASPSLVCSGPVAGPFIPPATTFFNGSWPSDSQVVAVRPAPGEPLLVGLIRQAKLNRAVLLDAGFG